MSNYWFLFYNHLEDACKDAPRVPLFCSYHIMPSSVTEHKNGYMESICLSEYDFDVNKGM